MLDESSASGRSHHGGGGSLSPGRPERIDGPRPAIDPPAPPVEDAHRLYPSTYRTLTREDVLDILKSRGPSTRRQMFEHVFGPAHLSACESPSSYVHDAVTDLDKVGLIIRRGHERRSQIWALAKTPAQPPVAPLFDGVGSSEADASPAGETAPMDHATRARTFVADVVLPNLAIPLRDCDLAEALVADIFAEPHAPLPETALVAGWRSDLADLAYASSEDLRSVRFAGLEAAKAEAAWNEILVGYAVQPSEHGIALRLVVDAMSGAEAPADFGRAWVGDAFAQLRMSPTVETGPEAGMQSQVDAAIAEPPVSAPLPETVVRPVQSRRPAPASPTNDSAATAKEPDRPGVSEVLKRKASVDFTSDSPAGQLSVRYAPMIRQAYDAGVEPDEIAGRLVAEAGIPIPLEMAVLLIRRVCACAR